MFIYVVTGAVLAAFVHIIIVDFRSYRIRNKTVVLLVALYPFFLAAYGWHNLQGDLIAGGLLFGLSFLFWMLGLMGAGDAKLALPLGMFCGMQGLTLYVIGLLITSIVVLIAVKLAARLKDPKGAFLARMKEISQTGAVPYAIPMLVAGGLTVVLRAIVTVNQAV